MSINYDGFAFPKGSKKVLKRYPKDISPQNRKKVKEAFKGLCGLCGKRGVHCHHIIYKSEDKSKIDDLDNLFLVCLECHKKIHRK